MTMSIGELARRTRVAPSSIRYYEAIGVLPPAERVAGRRRYGPDAVKLLRFVRVAKRAGLSLDEIREVVVPGILGARIDGRMHRVAERKLREVDASIAQARVTRRWLQGARTSACRTLDEWTEGWRPA